MVVFLIRMPNYFRINDVFLVRWITSKEGWLNYMNITSRIYEILYSLIFVQEVKSTWILYQIYCDAYFVMWMSILFCCVLFEIRSGFIPLHWVVFPTVGNLLRYHFFNKWRGIITSFMIFVKTYHKNKCNFIF